MKEILKKLNNEIDIYYQDESTVHFKVKELPNFLFGITRNISGTYNGNLWDEHHTNLYLYNCASQGSPTGCCFNKSADFVINKMKSDIEFLKTEASYDY